VKVGILVHPSAHQIEHANALAEGLDRHGVEATIYREERREWPAEDVVACWGWRLGKSLRDAGKDVLVLERGFIDRMNWTSLGWNGLNGRASRPQGSPGRFWRSFPRVLRKWAPSGSYGLVIGQVVGDMSVAGVDLPNWYASAAREIQSLGLDARFRPHPVAIEHGEPANVPGTQTTFRSLAEDLADAAVVVTFNSNTGVDAMLAGKPTCVFDAGSMAWPVAVRNCVSIQDEPMDRLPWAESLAWGQFSLDEIRSGFAWDCVKDVRNFRKPN
jgi:hypothetical protein